MYADDYGYYDADARYNPSSSQMLDLDADSYLLYDESEIGGPVQMTTTLNNNTGGGVGGADELPLIYDSEGVAHLINQPSLAKIDLQQALVIPPDFSSNLNRIIQTFEDATPDSEKQAWAASLPSLLPYERPQIATEPTGTINATQLIVNEDSEFRVWCSSGVSRAAGPQMLLQQRYDFLNLVTSNDIGLVVSLENNHIASPWLDGPQVHPIGEIDEDVTQYAPAWPYGEESVESAGVLDESGQVAKYAKAHVVSTPAEELGQVITGWVLNKSVLVRVIRTTVDASHHDDIRRGAFVQIVYRYWQPNKAPTYADDFMEMLYFIYQLQGERMGGGGGGGGGGGVYAAPGDVVQHTTSVIAQLVIDNSRGGVGQHHGHGHGNKVDLRNILIQGDRGVGRPGTLLALWRCMLPRNPAPQSIDAIIMSMRTTTMQPMVSSLVQYEFLRAILLLVDQNQPLAASFYPDPSIFRARYQSLIRNGLQAAAQSTGRVSPSPRSSASVVSRLASTSVAALASELLGSTTTKTPGSSSSSSSSSPPYKLRSKLSTTKPSRGSVAATDRISSTNATTTTSMTTAAAARSSNSKGTIGRGRPSATSIKSSRLTQTRKSTTLLQAKKSTAASTTRKGRSVKVK